MHIYNNPYDSTHQDFYRQGGARNPWEVGYPRVLGNKAGRYTMQLIEDGGLRPSKIITHRLGMSTMTIESTLYES